MQVVVGVWPRMEMTDGGSLASVTKIITRTVESTTDSTVLRYDWRCHFLD